MGHLLRAASHMTPLVVRAPNHLGDLVMALPAIQALQPADVVLPRWLVPVLGLAGIVGQPIPLDRGNAGLLAAARKLRRRRYPRGVLLAPSFSAALLFALGGVRTRRGARTDARGFLITEPVPDSAMAGLHRSATYHVLAFGAAPSPLPAPSLAVDADLRARWRALEQTLGREEEDGGTAGGRDAESGEHALPSDGDALRVSTNAHDVGGRGSGDGCAPEAAVATNDAPSRRPAVPHVGGRGPGDGLAPDAASATNLPPSRRPAASPPDWALGLTVGLFPGSNASSRRWDSNRFAELACRVAQAGARVLVFGAGSERELTGHVAAAARAGARARPPGAPAGPPAEARARPTATQAMTGAPSVIDAGGRTDLPLLAAGLASCDVLVTNDSGPMHLAAAVGTRTVSLQGPSDPRRTRPLGEGHVLLQHPELACVPCVRNVCPRRGPGTFLAEAQRECLRLIEVADVEAAVRAGVVALR